jgi:hypothetical protein
MRLRMTENCVLHSYFVRIASSTSAGCNTFGYHSVTNVKDRYWHCGKTCVLIEKNGTRALQEPNFES